MCRDEYTCEIKNIVFFFSGLPIMRSFYVTTYFTVRGCMTVISKGCRWRILCGINVARNILLKWGTESKKKVSRVSVGYPFMDNIDKFIAYSLRLIHSVFCVVLEFSVEFLVFYWIPSLQITYPQNITWFHQRSTILLPFKRAPLPLLCSNGPSCHEIITYTTRLWLSSS